MVAISEIHAVLGKHGEHDRHQLKDKVLILVSDVVAEGVSFDAALNYLKPVRWQRLIAAAPVAMIAAIDRMHVLADEIHALLSVETVIGGDHYFQQIEIPTNEVLMDMLDSLDDGTNLAQQPKRSYT